MNFMMDSVTSTDSGWATAAAKSSRNHLTCMPAGNPIAPSQAKVLVTP